MANNTYKDITMRVKASGVKETEAALRKLEVQAGKVKGTFDLGGGVTLQRTITETDKLSKVIYDVGKAEKLLAAEQKNVNYVWGQQLNNMLGVNRAFKSAAESAKVFAKAEKQAATQAAQVGKNVKTAADGVKNLSNFYQRFSFLVQRYVITRALNAFGAAMRDAFTEMKNVDSELITIQKVTGATKDEIDRLTQSAYEVAAALGTTASEYLNAVGEFSKAGYGQQAEQLGELAIMAANVGDTTQETANQFLLATDKAYQFNGSVEDLTRVLDGANEIGNRFATDVEHIASGLGTVAPIAAQAHVGVDELTSAIGTITAVTQRSGTEAARALRALFLNIMGDTKTEIEDGVTWTENEIKGLRDVLRKYSPEAVKAADATGSLVDPMEAIAGLSKAFKEGVLNEQQLMAMVSDIGGKLRSSQLLALIQNWDMYQQMMETYATSAGSAAQEYSIYLDSWEAKTKQLTAAWTNFVQHFVNTDAIKGMLDLLKGFISVLDTTVGRFAIATIAVGAFTHAITLLGTTAVKGAIGAFFKSAAEGLKLLIAGFKGATVAVKEFEVVDGVTKTVTKNISAFTAAWKASPFAVATAVAAGLFAIYEAFKYFDERLERSKERIQEYTDKISGLESEFDALQKKLWSGDATQAERDRLDLLEAELEVQQKLLAAEREYAYELASKEYDRDVPRLIHDYNALVDTYDTLVKNSKDVVNQEEHLAEQGFTVAEVQAQIAGSMRDVTVEQAALMEQIIQQIKEYEDLEAAGVNLTAADQQRLEQLRALVDAYSGTTAAVNAQTQADKLLENEGVAAASRAATKFITANTNMQASALNTVAAIKAELQALISLYSAMTSVAGSAATIAGSFVGGGAVGGALGQSIKASLNAKKAEAERLLRGVNEAVWYSQNTPSVGPGGGPVSTSPSGGGSSRSSSKKEEDKTDKYLESLKSIVSLRKSELDLLEAQNAPVAQQVAKIKEIQNSLHSQAEYLRKTKGSQEDINKLSAEWLKYQQEIAKLQEQIKDDLDDAIKNKLSEAEDKMEAQVAAIQEQIDALEKSRDIEQDKLDLEEKQNAVLEARIALQNALNERTVRYYNAATGQWEWGANASNVRSAEEALASAEKELEDYQQEQAYDAKVAELERQQDLLKKDYEELEKTWDAISKAMEKPTNDIIDDLKDLAKNGTPEMKRQVDNIIQMLKNLGVALSGEEEVQIRKDAGLVTEKSSGGGGGGASNQVYSVGGSGKNFVYNTQSGNISVNGRVVKPGDANYAATKAAMEADTGKKFDRGGILSGLGGIKATAFDEMIVPPDITDSMLDPSANSTFRRRMSELRFLYGGASSIPASLAGTVDNRIGSQHNGDIYQMGGISINEQQAKSMTVYQLAQLSRNLKLANNG